MPIVVDPGPLPTTFLNILQPWDSADVINTLLVAILLFFSALISASEVAYFALSPRDHERLNEDRSKSSKLALELLSKPKTLLATMLIGNNLVNVAIVILSSFMMESIFDFGNRTLVAFFVQVVAVTLIILLIGEISPKVIASKRPLAIAQLTAYPMAFMRKLFSPLSKLMVRSTRQLDQRARETERGNQITADELSHALELTTDIHTKAEEKRILSGIVKFGSTEVRQVMTPRIDVICFDKEEDYPRLQREIIRHGFSRIPVYEEGFDNVIGVLYVKDLLPFLDGGKDFEWQKLLRPPVFVTENKKLDDLLREFQETKNHMAIVVDEYGGSSGIITLEDVIEEIVGDIRDEFDEEEIVYSKLDDSNYVFEGKTALIDMYRALNIDGEKFEGAKGDSDSLAGFILELSGKIPQKNDKIRFNDFLFTVESADKRRVKRVKVTLMQEAHR